MGRLLIKVLIILVLLTAFSCSKKNRILKHSFFRLDTVVDVMYADSAKTSQDTIWKEIDSLLADYEARFSVTGDKSEIQKINNRNTQTVPVSRGLGRMIRTAIDYGDSLDGGFDFTILPLKNIWGLAEDSPEDMPLPSPGAIDSALALTDYRQVSVTPGLDTMKFSSGRIRIDVGGVAKGFALREIASLLEKRGIHSYLVNGGGDIIGKGSKPDGSSWVIGIQHPRKSTELLATFSMDYGAVFTSGDYERFRDVNGKRIHHLFNPHTGYSATANQSVTIYGPDPIQDKFLSTGLFSLPADSILAYVNSRTEIECLVVDSCGKVHVSSRWKDRCNIIEQ